MKSRKQVKTEWSTKGRKGKSWEEKGKKTVVGKGSEEKRCGMKGS